MKFTQLIHIQLSLIFKYLNRTICSLFLFINFATSSLFFAYAAHIIDLLISLIFHGVLPLRFLLITHDHEFPLILQ